MDLTKKIAKIAFALFLVFFVVACDKGCVESNEFDSNYITIDSNPTKDGIEGLGDAQVAQWHDSGLKTDGSPVVIQLTGSWVPWYGSDDYSSQSQLNALQPCSFCSMSPNSPNCICHNGQTPESEPGYEGTDCATNNTVQDDPSKCTCTRNYGKATDYGVYHFPLNVYDKSHNILGPDNQTTCRYTGGMGLYLGVFGSAGSVTPIRAYHLFSEASSCGVPRIDGKCVDDAGNDLTKYTFYSANSRTFVKDDNQGNEGPETNPSGSTLHDRNEVLKLIILDSRYDDNFGSYQVSFLSGVGADQEAGLLEFVVRLVEDNVMGKPDSNGVRQGGIIQIMFNNIVADSGFSTIVQMSLSFYILFYGMATLIGVANVSQKELFSRAVKIALVIFFTSPTSWYWYDRIVVTFFKDGMDSVISMFMSFSDQNLDPSSGIITAQMDRASINSNATRFSYVDLIIRNMLSVATSKKIIGLFFGVPLFGIVYIALIYVIIAAFIYVMLQVAMAYIMAMVKLAFVLSLGPIFIAFTLFSHTKGMFNKWLAFVGARSLEIIFIFLILYNFLVLIDQRFTSLLSYRVCVSPSPYFFMIPVLQAEVNRSLMDWLSSIVILAGLIFITKVVLDKIDTVTGALIKIEGQGGGGGSMGGGTGIMGGMMGGMKALASSSAVAMAAAGAAKAYSGISSAISRSGAGAAAGAAISSGIRSLPGGNAAMNTMMKGWNALPTNPRGMYRNSLIDAAIKESQAKAKKDGLTGKAFDEAVRKGVIDKMMTPSDKYTNLVSNPAKAAAMGLNMDTIKSRMDEQLINKPLADFIKSKSAELKAEGNLIGKDLRDKLHQEINNWADKNLSGGKESIQGIMNDKNAVVNGVRSGGLGLDNMSQFLRKHSEYTAAEAAKAFANDPDKQKQYLQHLQDNQFRLENERKKASEAAFSKTFNSFSNRMYDRLNSATKAIKPFDNAFGNDALNDPKRAAESFMRKVSNKEEGTSSSEVIRGKTGSWVKYGQGSFLNPFNLMKSKAAIKQDVKSGNRSASMSYFSSKRYQKEIADIKKNYADKIKAAPNNQAKNALKNKMNEKLRDSEKRRQFFKDQLKNSATKHAAKDAQKIADNLKKIETLERDSWMKFGEQTRNRLSSSINKLFFSKNKLDNEKKLNPLDPDLNNGVQPTKPTEGKTDRPEVKDLFYSERNQQLEQEKKDAIKEAVKLRTESQSLEDIVAEIKGHRSQFGHENYEFEEEKNALKKDYLREMLEEEHKKALDEYAKFATSLLGLGKEEIAALNTLSDRERQDEIAKMMEEKFPTVIDRDPLYVDSENLTKAQKKLNDKQREEIEAKDKKLEEALSKLTKEQRDEIENRGGIEAIKDGLFEANGTTLLEATERLNYFNKEFPILDKGKGFTSDEDLPLEDLPLPIQEEDIVIDDLEGSMPLPPPPVDPVDNDEKNEEVVVPRDDESIAGSQPQLPAVAELNEVVDEVEAVIGKLKRGKTLDAEDLEAVEKLNKMVDSAKEDDRKDKSKSTEETAEKEDDGKEKSEKKSEPVERSDLDSPDKLKENVDPSTEDDGRKKSQNNKVDKDKVNIEALLQMQLVAFKAQFDSANRKVSELQQTIEKLKRDLDKSGGQDEVLKKQISDLQGEISSNIAIATDFSGRISEVENRISSL